MSAHGFGDGDIGALPWATMDPTSPYGALSVDQVLGTDVASAPAAGVASAGGGVADLERAADMRNNSLQNVDIVTALQSKLAGTFGSAAVLPLAIMGLGVVAIALSPPSGGRRR